MASLHVRVRLRVCERESSSTDELNSNIECSQQPNRDQIEFLAEPAAEELSYVMSQTRKPQGSFGYFLFSFSLISFPEKRNQIFVFQKSSQINKANVPHLRPLFLAHSKKQECDLPCMYLCLLCSDSLVRVSAYE